MFEVLYNLVVQHDLRLVIIAAAICMLSAFACVSILVHARQAKGAARHVWVAIASVAVGFGIWATHFVAMLSFDAGFHVGYDIGLTGLSLLIAILVCGGGLWFAAQGTHRGDLALGGAVVGIGIAVMHFTGMASLVVGGAIEWNSGAVAASILLGMALGGAALYWGSDPANKKSRWVGAGLLTLAVCSMHFTAMGAAGFENCYAIVGETDMSPANLSLAATLASIFILLFALGAVFLDARERKRSRLEADRMRGLADAAVEGLIVCDDQAIVAVNTSFENLVGGDKKRLPGRSILEFIPSSACQALLHGGQDLVETELHAHNGELVPVELVIHEIDFGGKPHHAIAVRDLRNRKEAERHIRFLAHHDALTGLPNRASFSARLESEIMSAAEMDKRFAVLCLDLDRFKDVNDLFGHAAGDALLRKVASALERTLGGDQIAARLGGDEFALIVPDITTPAEAGHVAQAILDAFRKENQKTHDGTLISASIGIAIYPKDAEEAEHLMNCADTALYSAKDEGRGIYKFFEMEMGAQLRDRRLLEHDARHAVVRNELSLVYQPQVDIKSGEVTGFEALVRWDHPERGRISPAEFIPVAEDSGLILQIGEWVLRHACQQAAKWQNPLSIAINVSPVQLHAPQFPALVCEILFETGLAPNRLEIEVTETALVKNMSRALSALRQIKALGVKVAMDDFGTGYSSLSNLRAFPFDKLKVDQSFIKSVDSNGQSAAIVQAVLGLGKGLNLPVLAEGVERPEELEFLRGAVCQSAQGYWFGRPQTIDVYEAITSGTTTNLDTIDFEPMRERRSA
ncbi:sensor domain-containing diguanylate cyclase [Pelagibacterium lentulum]|uniref:Diguanylate cyclase n=1 Tax=Pelagibacterium lentulum TaxID=2029865 RepID=A0A916R7E5_9HYPH|nr:EAL domain-containing protein [Pelagibacterium lentulum]GGA40004.1 diguanylate cyclase [Pelagibacterium lentulum]